MELRIAIAGDDERKAELPTTLGAWLDDNLQTHVAGRAAEWSADEIYLSLPRPGGDGWLSIDRARGAVAYELTRRGHNPYINDLPKGPHPGAAWRGFPAVFPLACLVFRVPRERQSGE